VRRIGAGVKPTAGPGENDLLGLEGEAGPASRLDARELVLAVEHALTRERTSPQVPALLRFVLMKISELLHCAWAAAWVFSEDEDVWKIAASIGLTPEAAALRFRPGSALPCQVGERGAPLLINDLTTCEFFRSTEEHYRMNSALYAPVKIGALTVGVLAIYSDQRGFYSQQDLELLMAVAEHLGMVVASAILEDRARRIALLEERNRQARDLHDGVQQVLLSLQIYVLDARTALIAGDTRGAVGALDECVGAIGEAYDELRSSIAELRQHQEPLRDVYSVGERMHRRLAAAGVQVRFNFDRLPLEDAVSDTLAWVCREATTNVLKHSHARRVWMELRCDDGYALLRIRDDGVGITPAKPAEQQLHIGLQVMRERAEDVGGGVKISSSAARGVRVDCRVPLGRSSGG
jgi:two-component system nitrate/nitrite sensor histidine kinase NarX